MALRGRRINNFLELRCLVALGDLSVLVSSFTFQKSKIGWLQQPPTEKVLKFYHQKMFSKHQNRVEFNNLDDSEVLSGDFPGLKTSTASLTSSASSASTTSFLNNLYSPFYQNTSWFWWLDHPWHQKKPIMVLCWGMDHQKSHFSLIFDTFLSEAVKASRCYFFVNWLMKVRCLNLLKPLGTLIQENYWSFYPSELFRILRFNMRHHVSSKRTLFLKPVIFFWRSNSKECLEITQKCNIASCCNIW